MPCTPSRPLLVVTKPFRRIAMDVVGPLPMSLCGNLYILVLCDYMIRYPEAVPLHSVDAEHVAEESIKVFARVEIHEEILTDPISLPSYLRRCNVYFTSTPFTPVHIILRLTVLLKGLTRP